MKAILVVGLVASAGWAQSSVELTLVPSLRAKRVTFRLEVREVMYGAYVQGCVPHQTHRPGIIIRGNRSPDSAECNPAFETISSDLQHNAALSLGVGWVF